MSSVLPRLGSPEEIVAAAADRCRPAAVAAFVLLATTATTGTATTTG